MTRDEMMTREEFEQGYAARSGVTVEWLKENGRIPWPCDCDEDGCEGWKMMHIEEWKPRTLGPSDRADTQP